MRVPKNTNTTMKEGNFSALVDTSSDMSGISDEALMIFSWIVYCALCLGMNGFGIITNIINIVYFLKQGFKDSVNVSLCALSMSDLCCLITLALLNIGVIPAIQTADLTFDLVEVIYSVGATLHLCFSRISSWITAIVTLERCLGVALPLKIKSIFTPRRTAGIIIVVSIILMFSTAPVYTVNKLGMKFSQQQNKTIFGLIFTENRDHVHKINFLINYLSIRLVAFIIIFVCTVTLVTKLQTAAKWRHKSTTSSQADRLSNRNKKVAKMVVMISTLFIACFIPICITYLVAGFESSLFYGGKYFKVSIMIDELSLLLESVNSSMNVFIYYYMSSKYKVTIWKLFFKFQQ